MTPTLTTDQLADAYAAARKADWPPLSDIQLQATRMKLIEGLAIRRARGERLQPAPHPAPPAPARHAPPLPHTPAQLDFKSRAAGERAEAD